MLANFFVLWLLLAVGGGFLLFFGGLLASWIGEEMACFLLATALLALAGALIIQLRERAPADPAPAGGGDRPAPPDGGEAGPAAGAGNGS